LNTEFKVRDLSLADEGRLNVEWAEKHMPVLMRIRERFKMEKPLRGITVAGSVHVTKETAALIGTLQIGGAELSWCGCNPLTTQDNVAAFLARDGTTGEGEPINIYAWKGQTAEEYYWCIDRVLDAKPNITLDDGCDLVFTAHTRRPDLLASIIGGCEETTTGVKRLEAMVSEKALRYPIIAVNNAITKSDFDNIYGTGQGTIDAIMRLTSVLIAGKNFVVAGYGHCGSGVARRASGMGARVIVTEVDPIKALRAVMDGFTVMPMAEAVKVGDIFNTVTGCKDIITKDHFMNLKDGAILSNSGHFNVEVRVDQLEEIAKEKRRIRPLVDEYTLPNGRRIYLLAEGRLVNISGAEGHPPEIMDMSFANQALCVEYLAKRGRELEPKVYDVPTEIDRRVAELKLQTMGMAIDRLSDEQIRYLKSWKEGTR
jgi:adenosylhomocysteinase